MPLPPPRRESFHFSPTGTNPPDYSSFIALVDDSSPRMLTVTQNERAVLKESYILSSQASYSCAKSCADPVQQPQQLAVPTNINNCSIGSNTQTQERKVSSLKLTPITMPDPPDHCSSYLDPHTKAPSSRPSTSTSPQTDPTPSSSITKTASLSVHLGGENVKRQETSSGTMGVQVLDQTPNQALLSPQVEIRKEPPVVPPRPSPADLLVHESINTITIKHRGHAVKPGRYPVKQLFGLPAELSKHVASVFADRYCVFMPLSRPPNSQWLRTSITCFNALYLCCCVFVAFLWVWTNRASSFHSIKRVGGWRVSHVVFFPCILCDSVATEQSHSPLFSSPPPIISLSSQNQGPSSPDPAARHSPYHYHSSESLDFLSGLMPKALSPTLYVFSGAGSMAYTVSRANVSSCLSPSASPVTVSALSHYSSSTAGLLDELQICSLDTPGASPTPSPTLSHVSAYPSTAVLDDALTASAAEAATFTNVIISANLTCHDQRQNFPSFPTHLDDWSQSLLSQHSRFTFC